MKLILEGERPPTWNTFYAAKHWMVRKKNADRIHELVHYAIMEQYPEWSSPFKKQVNIIITVYFKSRPQDPCNITAKLYIDGFLGKVIEDDSPKYVNSVTTKSRVDKDNPRVEIEINAIQDRPIKPA